MSYRDELKTKIEYYKQRAKNFKAWMVFFDAIPDFNWDNVSDVDKFKIAHYSPEISKTPETPIDFNAWFDKYERDGGELMLYNTIDLEAAWDAAELHAWMRIQSLNMEVQP
jgi:hypothetical protein